MALGLHYVFFPGVVFHELSHYLACILTGVEVKEVRLFDPEEAFVRHAVPRAWQAVVISIAPFVVGTIAGYYLLLFAMQFFARSSIFSILFFWLGFSVVLFSFPSTPDAMNAFNSVFNALKNRISKGSIPNRIAWALVSPIVFLPLILITGFFLLFDKIVFLRILWAAFLFLITFNPAWLFSIWSFLDSLLKGFFSWIFKGIL